MTETNIISHKKQQESLIRTDDTCSALFAKYPILSNRKNLFYNLRDAVSADAPAMSIIANKSEETIVLKWIRAQLLEVFLFTGAINNVSEYQAIALAKHIYGMYYYLTFEEMTYFFHAFENGLYGTLYVGTTINVQNIMQALAKFKADALEQRGHVENERKQMQQKENDKGKLTGMDAWLDYCKKSGRANTDMPDINKITKQTAIK